MHKFSVTNIAAVVAISVSLVAPVWNTALWVRDTHELATGNQAVLTDRGKMFEELYEGQRKLNYEIDEKTKRYLSFVYLDENHMVLRTSDGIPIKAVVAK